MEPINTKKMWDFLPVEVLVCIFKFLDSDMLLNCMFVNKKWKDAAEHVAECQNAWPDILHTVNFNELVTNKTALTSKDLFANSILWGNVQVAEPRLKNTFKLVKVKNISIYKDQLIICTGNAVEFHDIKTGRVNKILLMSCIDYQENDFMVLKMYQTDRIGSKDLELCAKTNDEEDRDTAVTITNVTHYLLRGEHCYTINEYNLWMCTRIDHAWIKTFIGRFYGDEFDVTGLHVYKERVYIATKRGKIYTPTSQEDLLPARYHYYSERRCLNLFAMFHNIDVVVTDKKPIQSSFLQTIRSFIAPQPESKPTVDFDLGTNQCHVSIRGVTCVLEHGPVLFIGLRTGMVYAYLIKSLRQYDCSSEPLRCYNVADFDPKIKDRSIIAIEIHEAFLSHRVFIATRTHVFQVELSYPENLEFWDYSSLSRINSRGRGNWEDLYPWEWETYHPATNLSIYYKSYTTTD